jgi:hypothetical protein
LISSEGYDTIVDGKEFGFLDWSMPVNRSQEAQYPDAAGEEEEC